MHAEAMNATDLIDLAVKICRTKDRSQRQALAEQCPSHLLNLLRSTIKVVRHSNARKKAIAEGKKRKADYRFTYKFQPLPTQHSRDHKPVIPKVALNTLSNVREKLGINHV